MTTLFRALVLPRVDYCSQLWAPYKQKDWAALEGIQRTYTSYITEVKHLDYWSRLQCLNLYSIQRRMERYIVLYVWKILEGMAPNTTVHPITSQYNQRRGRTCIIPRLPHHTCPSKIRNLREASFSVRGPQLFNCLPQAVRNIEGVSLLTFKSHLDKALAMIPDEPSVPGYVGGRRAASNSLLDMLPMFNIDGGRSLQP